jgi:hypothetical protein
MLPDPSGRQHTPRKGGPVINRLQERLTYANVMSTLAVFVALGGTSYAAFNLTGADIRDGSLTGRDLKANSIDGKRVKEKRLATVPRARNAERLNGISAGRLLVRCPRDTAPVSNTCIETAARAPLPYGNAAVICEDVQRRRTPGRRLPNHDELMTAIGDFGIQLANRGELTRNVYPSTTDIGGVNVLVINDPVGRVEMVTNTPAGARAFRCVADPLN